MNPAAIFKVKNKAFQILVNVIIIMVIILIIYKMYIKFSDKIKASIRNNKIEKDLADIVENGANDEGAVVSSNVKTYTDADYMLMAEALYESMDGIGTDVDSIFSILNSLRSKADWYALAEAFGIRKTSWTPWSDFEGSLTKWLGDELDSGEKKQVNEILSKFGVGRI